MMISRNVFLAVAVSFAAVGCAWNPNAAPRSTRFASDRLAVDVSWEGNLPFVSVEFGASGPYRFLLDTGAESTFISAGVARELELDVSVADLRIDAAGAAGDHRVGTTTIPEMTIGGARFTGIPAVVAEKTPGIDGVLGFPVFADVLLTLDGPGRRIVLERGSLPRADSSGVVELVEGDQVHESPEVFGRVAGRRALILIDSGFDGFLYLARSIPGELDLDFAPNSGGARTVLTHSGPREVIVGTLREKVELGSVEFEDLETMVGMGPPVILGGGVLRELVSTFDQKTRRARFTRASR